MIRVIDGLRYDTETAEEICDITPQGSRSMSRSDFRWEDTRLYRTRKGRFFVAGEGGALSQWAQPTGGNGSTAGEGLRPITEKQARYLVESFADAATYTRVFGPTEDA